MLQNRKKRKGPGEGNLIRKTRAKYRKIVAETRDDYEDNATSDVSMEDAASSTNFGQSASSLSPRLTAGRQPQHYAANGHTAQHGTLHDLDPLSQAELELSGEQAEIAAQEVEKELAMTSDQDGRIYQPANDVAEPLPLMSLPKISRNTNGSAPLLRSNPFINPPTSPTSIARHRAPSTFSDNTTKPVLSKQGRPTRKDTGTKQRQDALVGIIGHNEDTGSPVYLSDPSTTGPKHLASPQTSIEKVDDRVNPEDTNVTEFRSKAREGKNAGPTQKLSIKASKASAEPLTKSVKKPITKAASVKRLPPKTSASTSIRTSTPTATPSPSVEYVSSYPTRSTFATVPTSAMRSSSIGPPDTTRIATPKPLTPEGTNKQDEARRKERRRQRRARSQEELQEAREMWEGHKMPRNWGLIALPEDEI